VSGHWTELFPVPFGRTVRVPGSRHPPEAL